MTAETPIKTLAGRLLAITAEVGPVKATGKSPFSGEPAQSIGDIEDALRPLLIKHGVLIRFRGRQLTKVDREWVTEVTAVVGATDLPGEDVLDDWADCGSTPAAAYSFARKSYMKATFHIADTEEHAAGKKPPASGKPPAGGKVTVVSREVTGRLCPEDGGDLELVTWSNHQKKVCCVNWKDADGACKYREDVA